MVIKNPLVEVNLEWKFKYKTTLDIKVTLEVENISENKFFTNSTSTIEKKSEGGSKLL